MNLRALIILLIFFVFIPCFLVSASTSDGTIDSEYKYAWSSNGGWLNFGTESGNVNITDSALTGYFWSENYGWINLSPSTGGVLNDEEGGLSGNAWGENTGWIDFSDIAINSSGEFTGTAENSVLGTITFNCSNCGVKTDWRPASSRVSPIPPPPSAYCGDNSCNGSETCETCSADCGECVSGGAGNSENQIAVLNPFEGFLITINSGAESTNSAQVNVQISGGQTNTISRIDISNFSDFQDSLSKTYQVDIPWVLTLGDGEKNVYVKLYNAQNQSSDTLTSNIELITRLPDIEVAGSIGSISGGSGASYSSNQDVVISGKTDPKSTVIISYDDKYASVKSDESGKYSANIGKIQEGSRPVELNVVNQHGNSRSVKINVVVEESGGTAQNIGSALQEEKKSIFTNITKKIQTFFNVKSSELIEPTIIINKKIPPALTGKWALLRVAPQKINK